DKLYTFSLDRATGRIKWRRDVPRPRNQELHKSNSPASPSPVSDARNVYVFFTGFGLISFGPDGNERWRLPLGPFNNPFGMGASPVLAGNTLLMICDSETGSFFMAAGKDTGKQRWRVERPEFTRGFSTPLLYKPERGALQAIIAGSSELTAYEVETGNRVWWTRGLTWQLKPTPVMNHDTIFVMCRAGGAGEGQREKIIGFSEALKIMDANHDGKLQKEEITHKKLAAGWGEADLDKDGAINERDWRMYQGRRSVVNAITAFRLGGSGDITETGVKWRCHKSLPNVPSPLLYKNVLYMMKEGGILTALDPANGNVLRQARVQGALGMYFASPVAAHDKIYVLSEEGKLAVIKPGPEWAVLAVNDLDDGAHATSAIADSRLYVRTHSAILFRQS
ncbi:MAG: PQQ-binding-like beta-propeller repeat protein, partial [Bryobacteraceae bacterium]